MTPGLLIQAYLEKGFGHGINLTALKLKVIKVCFKRYTQFLCQTLTIYQSNV